MLSQSRNYRLLAPQPRVLYNFPVVLKAGVAGVTHKAQAQHCLGGAISKSFFKINQFIQASELRVLDQFNKQLGVMTKSEALQKANELGVDLVEIAPSAKPPVAKLIDFAKFKYQIAQKAQEDKRKTKISEIKELRMTPVIAQGDFDARMKKARKFLEGGDKVRLNVKFAGRMITKKEYGEKVLKRAIDQLSDISMVEIPAKLIGKFMMMQLSPVKKRKPSDLQPKQPQHTQAPEAPKTEPKAKIEAKKE